MTAALPSATRTPPVRHGCSPDATSRRDEILICKSNLMTSNPSAISRNAGEEQASKVSLKVSSAGRSQRDEGDPYAGDPSFRSRDTVMSLRSIPPRQFGGLEDESARTPSPKQ